MTIHFDNDKLFLFQNSRPSSADSSHSNPSISNNATFRDILAQFAKMTPTERQLLSSNNSIISALNMTTQNALNAAGNKPPPYPEVTLHPVMNSTANTNVEHGSSSLLHGILTKVSSKTKFCNMNSLIVIFFVSRPKIDQTQIKHQQPMPQVLPITLLHWHDF